MSKEREPEVISYDELYPEDGMLDHLRSYGPGREVEKKIEILKVFHPFSPLSDVPVPKEKRKYEVTLFIPQKKEIDMNWEEWLENYEMKKELFIYDKRVLN